MAVGWIVVRYLRLLVLRAAALLAANDPAAVDHRGNECRRRLWAGVTVWRRSTSPISS